MNLNALEKLTKVVLGSDAQRSVGGTNRLQVWLERSGLTPAEHAGVRTMRWALSPGATGEGGMVSTSTLIGGTSPWT